MSPSIVQTVSQFQTSLLSRTLIRVPLKRNHWFMVFYHSVPLPPANPLYIPLFLALSPCPLAVPRFKRINLDWDNWAQAKVNWLCFMNPFSNSPHLFSSLLRWQFAPTRSPRLSSSQKRFHLCPFCSFSMIWTIQCQSRHFNTYIVKLHRERHSGERSGVTVTYLSSLSLKQQSSLTITQHHSRLFTLVHPKKTELSEQQGWTDLQLWY